MGRGPERADPAVTRGASARSDGRARCAGGRGARADGGGERAVGGVSLRRMRAGRARLGLYIGLAPAPAEPSGSGAGGEELLGLGGMLEERKPGTPYGREP